MRGRDATSKKVRQLLVPVVGWGAKLWFSARDNIIQLILTCVHLGHDFIPLRYEWCLTRALHTSHCFAIVLWNTLTFADCFLVDLLQNPFMLLEMPQGGPVLRIFLQQSLVFFCIIILTTHWWYQRIRAKPYICHIKELEQTWMSSQHLEEMSLWGGCNSARIVSFRIQSYSSPNQ